MLFALPAVRARLNLKSRPKSDPDVRARRLVVGDAYLANVLYGSTSVGQASAVPTLRAAEENVIAKGRSAWDIARDAYNDPTTLYRYPDGSVKRGNQIANFKQIPAGTRVTLRADVRENRSETYQVIGVNGRAQDIAGEEARSASTVYVYPDGTYARGSQLSAAAVLRLPYGTRVLTGYAIGGPVTASRKATDICGNRWRSAETFFLISGALVPGNKVDDSRIPVGTMLFFKN